jgi:outer membrane protein, multidrug efflux system
MVARVFAVIRRNGVTLAVITAVLTSCTVGPQYVPPHQSLPQLFTERADDTAIAPGDDGDLWWKNFNDPILDRLVSEALRSAPDILEAEARLRESRALAGVARADHYPTAHADAAYDRVLGSDYVPIGVQPGGLGEGITANLWQLGFDASWEMDIFGGVRREIEAANASYQVTVESRRDVTIVLIAEIARTYVALRGAQRQIEVARSNLAIQQDTLELTRALLDAGLAPILDVLQIQAQVFDTQASIAVLEGDARADIYRVGLLVGELPENLVTELQAPRPIPSALDRTPVGLPSDLLRRRPDIRAAERQIAASNARIGVATADLYPHFSLTGLAGLESFDSVTFLRGGARYYEFGPNFTWLIFDAGRVRFRIDAEKARTDQAVVAYQRTVLSALQEVETALSNYATTEIRRRNLESERETDAQAVTVATKLYREGVESFLPVLIAEQSLSSADDRLAQSERDAALALIAINKALGGGWQSAERNK